MKKILLGIFTIALISMIAVGCSNSEKIDGKWIEDSEWFTGNNSQSTLIYFKDGNKFELIRSGKKCAEGEYEIKDKNEVVMKGTEYAMNGQYDETKATIKDEGDDKKLVVHYNGGDEQLRMAKGESEQD